jgi:hypothetical protein
MKRWSLSVAGKGKTGLFIIEAECTDSIFGGAILQER